jgi:hypothetical protein
LTTDNVQGGSETGDKPFLQTNPKKSNSEVMRCFDQNNGNTMFDDRWTMWVNMLLLRVKIKNKGQRRLHRERRKALS